MTTTALQFTAYKQSDAHARESVQCLLGVLALTGVPDAMVDFGCGAGHMVRAAASLGVKSYGVDLNVEPWRGMWGFDSGYCELFQSDLTEEHTFADGPFPLVLCLETAEHLPESAANTLCDTLVTAVEPPNGLLVFSAATRGQGGAGHLNEQPRSYWLNKFDERGLERAASLTAHLSHLWKRAAPKAWWYGKNVMVFRMKED